eukprot:TRINITY_DN30388_c0_g1_i1.p1 TRINITY_DN30388_c0_g1~~TRINITY_DN30388_c0_g1_i1.p1  ORF type:complete len:254 (+),score=53.25 TRINITY_DN30388_c0_g1_i1:157-918(+)
MLRSLVGSEMCIRDRVEKRMKEVSQMWAGFSEVAAAQPEHAWFPTRRSADEIQHASPENRYVGWPYTKYHCSVIDVDQAAAVIIMSVAEARRRGVPEARWVYLHGCAETVEKDLLLREDLGSSPAIRRMGEVCFADAGVTVDQIRYFDLYSCFPCAVRIASRELGIDPVLAADGSRMTLTGGLAVHGGPGANYNCLLYTSDAADEEDSVDLGGRRIIKKKTKETERCKRQTLARTNIRKKKGREDSRTNIPGR